MAAINTVLITGSNRGIGLELVRQFLSRRPAPSFIFAACRNPSQAQELQKLAKEASSIHVIGLEIGKEETYKTAFAEVEKHTGDSGLDVLINNAGIFDYTTLDQVNAEDLTHMFQVNAVGPLMVAKTFLPLLRKAASRNDPSTKQAIINVSSMLSSMTKNISPGRHYYYKTAKAALNSISVQLADDLRSDGIIVIPICPGWVQTAMGGSSASLTPQQSVSGIIKVIDKLSISHSGQFFNYTGAHMDW